MGNGVGRVKEWMGFGEEREPPGTQCVRRYARMDEIDIRHYLVHWVKRWAADTMGELDYSKQIAFLALSTAIATAAWDTSSTRRRCEGTSRPGRTGGSCDA